MNVPQKTKTGTNFAHLRLLVVKTFNAVDLDEYGNSSNKVSEKFDWESQCRDILDKEKVVVLFMLLKLFLLLLFSLCNCDSKRRSRKMNRCRVHSFKSFRVLQTRLLFGDEMVRYSKVYGKKKSEKNCNESITGIHQTLCNRLDEDTMGTLLGE